MSIRRLRDFVESKSSEGLTESIMTIVLYKAVGVQNLLKSDTMYAWSFNSFNPPSTTKVKRKQIKK